MREMIRMPKLKYERLLKQSKIKKSLLNQTLNDDNNQKQMSEETLTDTSMSESIEDTSHTGNSYVSRTHTIGKTSGVPMKQNKKHIPWLTYRVLN